MSVAAQPQHLPPQDLDAEESVLGAMLVSPTAVAVVSELLRAEDFYRPSHATIYRTILEMYGGGESIDSITLTNALSTRGVLDEVGGRAIVHTLASTVPAAANARHYAQIVSDAATCRSLIQAGTQIAELGFERVGDPPELVDRAEQIVFSIADQRISHDFTPINTLLVESFERLGALAESGNEITGVPSGFRDLDRITAGFQESNLVILAARPSMGKTSLALNIAAHLGVRANAPVAIFSLEMSQGEVTQRLMCSEAKVDSKRLQTGRLDEADWVKLTNACDKLSRAPIYIDDSAGVTPIEIKAKTRRLQARLKGELALVVVDYLQLMGGQARVENRVQEISQISRALKLIARDLNVPVLALSQLSRAVEQRGDKRPQLSDLRESGSIEQDADLVMFVYRDDYYDPESEHKGEAELIVSKHRNGPLGTVQLTYLSRYTRFDNFGRT
ncbi:MAG TPA: replicative DNA helicase [Candidatus Dormibacteraeota bacterium]|nr:replicative DNA helicase [Candidatus Dormibacteraeota bacterium]